MRQLRNLIGLILVFFGAMSCVKSSSNDSTTPPVIKPSDFRVLGYVASDDNWNSDMAGLDFTKLTDINLAFLNPDASGNFTTSAQLSDAVITAHRNKVRIFFSIGGGGAPAYLTDLMKADKRAAVITSIVNIAVQDNFDGVDVDIENDLITTDYNGFVSDLSAALKAKKKLMTSALATGTVDRISDEVLAKYDFINIMSYDRTGPWTPDNPGPHAPYQVAVDDFNYFTKSKNIPASKILLGVPFYGYQFGTTVGSLNYKDIITKYPGSENADSVAATGGGEIYYNGMPTIKAKTAFAIANKAAGVMIWELHQDSNDAKSLLKVINDTKNQ